MMGYFLRNNPEEMIRSFLFQAPEKRYLPSEGSLIRFTSLEQAMPYAKLLRTLPDDHYTSASLRRRIAREAYRIGGLGGIEQFSRAHAGPDKSEEEQLKLLLQTSIPIYSRNQADEYFAFLSSLEDQWGLSSNYRDLVQYWADVDLQGASEWVREQTPGRGRDSMIEHFISNFEWIAPASVDEWIPLLSEERLKEYYLKEHEEQQALYQDSK